MRLIAGNALCSIPTKWLLLVCGLFAFFFCYLLIKIKGDYWASLFLLLFFFRMNGNETVFHL